MMHAGLMLIQKSSGVSPQQGREGCSKRCYGGRWSPRLRSSRHSRRVQDLHAEIHNSRHMSNHVWGWPGHPKGAL